LRHISNAAVDFHDKAATVDFQDDVKERRNLKEELASPDEYHSLNGKFKFTLLEKMDNMWWLKVITCCFKNSERMKYADLYKKLYRDF